MEKKGDQPKPRTTPEAIAIYDATPAHSNYSDALNREVAAETVEEGFNRFRITVGWPVEFENDNDDPNVLNEKAFRFKWQDSVITEQLLPDEGDAGEARRARRRPRLLRPPERHRAGVDSDPGGVRGVHRGVRPLLQEDVRLRARLVDGAQRAGEQPAGQPEDVRGADRGGGRAAEEGGPRDADERPRLRHAEAGDGYMQAMEQVPGALANFGQITYHLYWDPENVEARRVIRQWGEKLKVPVAQTEWMGASDMPLVRHLVLCLTEANAVAWDRYVRDLKVDAKAGTLNRQPTAWYLRQYFRYIRPGAVRVKMESPDPSVKPVAFLSPAKKPVMVFLNEGTARPVKIEGLPAGTYQASWSAAGKFAVAMPDRRARRG